MKRRTKNFIEDMIIIFVFCFAVYLIYFFVFSNKEEKFLLTENLVQTQDKKESFIELLYKDIKETFFKEQESIDFKVKEYKKSEEQNQEKAYLKNDLDTNNNTKEDEVVLPNNTSLNRMEIINSREILRQESNFDEEDSSVLSKEELKEENQTLSNENTEDENKNLEENINQNNSETKENNEQSLNKEQFFQEFEKKVYFNISKDNLSSNFEKGKYVNIRVTILKNGDFEQLTFVGGEKKYFDKIKDSIKKVFPLQIDDSLKNNFPRYYRMTISF